MTIRLKCLAVLAALSGLIMAQDKNPVDVTPCKLVERPNEFNGKLVRVSAIVTRTIHAGVITPRGCANDTLSNDIAITGPDGATRNTKRLVKLLKTGAATADFIGTFHSGDVFGPNNCCRFELRALSISNVKKLK